MDLKMWESITAVAVNGSLIVAAIAAVIKFKVYNIFSRRYRSDIQCGHRTLPSGKVIFFGNYIIHNTGELPIMISSVEIKIVGAILKEGLLHPDLDRVLANRLLPENKKVPNRTKGVYRIESGERSIFTLRTELDKLDDVVFIVCKFEWPYRRDPALFKWMYIKNETGDPHGDFVSSKPIDAL